MNMQLVLMMPVGDVGGGQPPHIGMPNFPTQLPSHPGQGQPGQGQGQGQGDGDRPRPGHGLPKPPGNGPSVEVPIALPPNQPWPPGQPIIPPNAPPGSVWPPIGPGSNLPSGKAIALLIISGVGARYAVVDFSNSAQPV